MTLFSESGILSVKTGGIRDEKGKSNDEEPARLDTSENALDRIIAAAAKMSLGEPEDTADEMVRKIPAHWISGIFRRDSAMSWRPTVGPIILSRS